MHRLRKVFWWAVVIFLLLAPFPASAGTPGGEIALGGVLGGILELYIVIAVPIYTFTNLSYALDDERPSQDWITGGYINGGLCIAGGAAWMFMSGKNDWDVTLLSVGIGHFVFGALDIGFTIWASQQPEKVEQKLTLGPIIMPDARGNAAFGVGLRLTDW